MALPRVNPDVLVVSPPSLAHFSGVTCLATKLCVDWMFGKAGESLMLIVEIDPKFSETEVGAKFS